MFKNIGGRIKGLAKTFYTIGVVLSCLVAAAAIIAGILSEEPTILIACIVGGAVYIGLGVLIAWLSNIMLYAFGQQVEMQEKSAILLEKIYRDMGTCCAPAPSYEAPQPVPTYKPAPEPVQEPVVQEPVCAQCGTQLNPSAAFCPNCGGKV